MSVNEHNFNTPKEKDMQLRLESGTLLKQNLKLNLVTSSYILFSHNKYIFLTIFLLLNNTVLDWFINYIQVADNHKF